MVRDFGTGVLYQKNTFDNVDDELLLLVLSFVELLALLSDVDDDDDLTDMLSPNFFNRSLPAKSTNVNLLTVQVQLLVF